MNLQKFYMGESFNAYEYFGAHLEDRGVVFRTYAPNAWGINVVNLCSSFTRAACGWASPSLPNQGRCTSM